MNETEKARDGSSMWGDGCREMGGMGAVCGGGVDGCSKVRGGVKCV